MTAYDYPLLGLFWTFLVFYFIVVWLVIMFHVIVDIFKRDDSGVLKALWLLVVFVLPILGVLAYVIVRGQGSSSLTVTGEARTTTAGI